MRMSPDVSGCPRHVERNYVPLFGVPQSNVDLRNYVPLFGMAQSNVRLTLLRNITSDCYLNIVVLSCLVRYSAEPPFHWTAIEHTY